MRKKPKYKTEILVKFAKKISVFKTSIGNKNLEVSDRMKKYRVTEQGLLLHPVQNSRDLESKMRKTNDVRHDNFGQTGRN